MRNNFQHNVNYLWKQYNNMIALASYLKRQMTNLTKYHLYKTLHNEERILPQTTFGSK